MFVDFRRAVLPWSSCLFATSSQPPRGLLAASSQSMDVRPPRPLASRRVCRGPVQSNKPAKPTYQNQHPAGAPTNIEHPTSIQRISSWKSNEHPSNSHRAPNEHPSNIRLELQRTSNTQRTANEHAAAAVINLLRHNFCNVIGYYVIPANTFVVM